MRGVGAKPGVDLKQNGLAVLAVANIHIDWPLQLHGARDVASKYLNDRLMHALNTARVADSAFF